MPNKNYKKFNGGSSKPIPVPKFLDDARAVDLIRFMQHKFDAVEDFLRDQSKLKVIIPADYQFYFKESEGKFTAYEEEINKVLNKNVYSNKLNFNLDGFTISI